MLKKLDDEKVLLVLIYFNFRNAFRYSSTLGFAKSIAQARQLVNHGHITVNKKLLVFQVFNVVLMTLLVLKKKAFQKFSIVILKIIKEVKFHII
jgi:hypothetical protein